MEFLRAILPAYFADYWQTVDRKGPITLDATCDRERRDSDWNVRGALGRIDVPTLVISGLYDFICPRRWSAEIREGVPDVGMLQLNQSGHFGYLEQEDEFVRSVLEFAR